MKIYVGSKGVIHDPTPEMIPVLAALNPSFKVETVQPPKGFVPKFQLLRQRAIGISENLFELSVKELREILAGNFTGTGDTRYSRLDIIYALSLRGMAECRLCGWNCGVNRFQEKGKCGLGHKLCNSKPFNHIAEEPPINTAIVTNFGGCALRCMYCISHEVWEPKFPPINPKVFWQDVQRLMGHGVPVNSVEFSNPTESAAGVFSILAHAPQDMRLAVVMNCHAHGSKLFYELAGPVTDVWLMDVRYGNNDCAKRLSGVKNYMEFAQRSLDAVAQQGSRVIVRVLVLPGHVDCCHEPAIGLLAQFKDKVWVSILDQYVPEKDAYQDPDLRRTPTQQELSKVEALVRQHGLRNIACGCADFWKE